MTQTRIEISVSTHMKTDKDGIGFPDGESFSLWHRAGNKIFRTMSFFGNKTAQEIAREEAQRDIATKVEIETE